MGATRKRNLRSGHSIWQRRPLSRFPARRLPRDMRCDVLVIGAGISGAMAAEQLSDAGLVGRHTRPARRRARFYPRLHRPAAIRDRHAAVEARRTDRQDARRTHLAPLHASRSMPCAIGRRRLGIAADCADKSSLYLEGNVLDARRPAGRGRGAPPRRLRSPPAFRQMPSATSTASPVVSGLLSYQQSRSQPASPGGGLSSRRAGARRPLLRAGRSP